jgi:tetratricopeptide (TPR) repeat protein
MELHNELYEKISSLCSQGDNLFEESMFDEAMELYLNALHLVPEPKSDWEASTWIYTALGDTSFAKKDFVASKNFLLDAINCPSGIENPFIILRLGESFYELKEFGQAKEYLLRTYLLEGYSIFDSEDDKYFNLIKDEI